MLSPVYYPCFNNLTMVSYFVRPVCDKVCPVFSWLAFGKLPENPIVTPGTTTQVIRPSSVNRFLETVTVKPAA